MPRRRGSSQQTRRRRSRRTRRSSLRNHTSKRGRRRSRHARQRSRRYRGALINITDYNKTTENVTFTVDLIQGASINPGDSVSYTNNNGLNESAIVQTINLIEESYSITATNIESYEQMTTQQQKRSRPGNRDKIRRIRRIRDRSRSRSDDDSDDDSDNSLEGEFSTVDEQTLALQSNMGPLRPKGPQTVGGEEPLDLRSIRELL